MIDEYEAFLRAKAALAPVTGFDVEDIDINPLLLPHQRAMVRWALAGGSRAIFAAFGLGKSLIQIEIVRLCQERFGGNALIVVPLGVRQEFYRDGLLVTDALRARSAELCLKHEDVQQRFAISFRFVRTAAEMEECPKFYLTNYESIRDGRLDPNLFSAVSLDEASVLRSFGSKTYQTFLSVFKGVPRRFVATATPSPNRLKELIHYAGFLGIMDTGQSLTRFFQRDSTQANHLTLYPHKEAEFWLWVSSWAAFVQRPSDLGFDDRGYDLPPLDIVLHELPATTAFGGTEANGQTTIMTDAALSLHGAAKEKRDSLPARIAKMQEIIGAQNPEEHWLIWHTLERERHAIESVLPDAATVYGTQDMEEREREIMNFADGRSRILATKAEIAGSGCNFQRHCHRAIFLGVDYKANDLMQAVHRIQRFQQKHPCTVHLIYTEAERQVVKTLLAKWQAHKEMVGHMSEMIKKHGLGGAGLTEALSRSLGVDRLEVSGKSAPGGKPMFTVANNDAVLEARRQPDSNTDLIVTSIPFANHYEYSASYNDMGHTDSNDHFWAQMDFLTPELLRMLAPGRLACVHVKDRILFGSVTGAGTPTVSPFHAEAIFHYRRHGFDFLGMITVVTDVVRENNQTYRLGWTENSKDSTKMGVGSPEYVLLFRKPQSDRTKGYADRPVTKDKADYTRARWQVDAHAFWRSSGNRHITAEEMAAYGPATLAKLFTEDSLRRVYDYEFHVKIGEELDGRGALPSSFMSLAPGSHKADVWHDVNRMVTLNTQQAQKGREAHICIARGSLVLTRGGYKPIQEVSAGEMVLTHKGRWRPVLAVQNTGVRPVVTVTGHGVPGLALTPDHKLWTRAVRDLPWSIAHSRREAQGAEPSWAEAQHTAGSYINLKLPDTEAASTEDETTWWTAGRWIACGHIDKRCGAVISCGHHKADDLVSGLGDYAGNPFHDTGTSLQLMLRDPKFHLRRILSGCGTGADKKRLPGEAFTLPLEQASALLAGYLSGDGHYVASRKRWTASSVSKELLMGVAMLAQRVYGAVASIYPGRPAGQCIIQGRTVNTKQDWVLGFDVPGPERRIKPFILGDGAWKKVRSIQPAGEAETWNLRVAEDESFTAEGCIVKNCPLQIDIVNRLIERYSNPGELVYDPFAGLGTVPYCAMKIGRRGGGSELSTPYFLDSVQYLRTCEEEMSMPTLFDFEESVRLEAEEKANSNPHWRETADGSPLHASQVFPASQAVAA